MLFVYYHLMKRKKLYGQSNNCIAMVFGIRRRYIWISPRLRRWRVKKGVGSEEGNLKTRENDLMKLAKYRRVIFYSSFECRICWEINWNVILNKAIERKSYTSGNVFTERAENFVVILVIKSWWSIAISNSLWHIKTTGENMMSPFLSILCFWCYLLLKWFLVWHRSLSSMM